MHVQAISQPEFNFSSSKYVWKKERRIGFKLIGNQGVTIKGCALWKEHI